MNMQITTAGTDFGTLSRANMAPPQKLYQSDGSVAHPLLNYHASAPSDLFLGLLLELDCIELRCNSSPPRMIQRESGEILPICGHVCMCLLGKTNAFEQGDVAHNPKPSPTKLLDSWDAQSDQFLVACSIFCH